MIRAHLCYAALGTGLAAGTLLFPGTTTPLVVNVTPAKAALPRFVTTGAAAADAAVTALADWLAAPDAKTPGLTLGSAPSALATATGSDVRPGLMSAA